MSDTQKPSKARELTEAIKDYEKAGITIHGKRRLTMSGGTGLAVTIPMPIIKDLGLKKGEKVTVLSYKDYMIVDLGTDVSDMD